MRDIVNVFFDASTYKNTLYIVYGDNKNSNLRRLDGEFTNNELEWYALLFAVKTINRKYTNVTAKVYGDSQLVIRQVNGDWKMNKEEFRILNDQVNSEIWWGNSNRNNVFVINWNRRNKNKAGVRLEKYIKKDKGRE